MRIYLSAAVFFALILAFAVLLGGCTGTSTGGTTKLSAVSSGDLSPTTESAATIPPIRKTVAADGSVTLGDLATAGFTLTLPADAYPAVASVSATWGPVDSAPPMKNAAIMGDGYVVDTGATRRLDAFATLTYHYDPATISDPMLLALGYHDGTRWTYILADGLDTEVAAVTFPLFHFSAYYPAQFKSELEAAKYYAAQMAAQKVLGEGNGDPRTASAALADLVVSKLGLGEDQFSRELLSDIAADQDVLKVFDELQTQGWTDTGYEYVMQTVCAKISQRLVQNKEALTADDVTGLTDTEAAFKRMGDVLRVGKYGSMFLSSLLEGDTDAAAKELFDLATDYSGLPGKALKYTLQGMQNALDVWRNDEVEKAFEVYINGSSGTLFGYGAVDAGNFDEVWDGMKGARRQLCIERIAAENRSRENVGMPPLSAVEEEFYREKVKQELKREFDRRISLADKIEAHRKNLELIFTELDAAKMFDGTNIWIRSLNDPYETLESRLHRFNKLIGRVFKDLKITTVYSGPQQQGELDGRISAAAIAEMLRGYFSADTQAQGEAFLQEYYKKFQPPVAAYAGTYRGVLDVEWGGPFSFTIDKLGKVTGSWRWRWTHEGTMWNEESYSISGQVSPQGVLTATGTDRSISTIGDTPIAPEQTLDCTLTGQIGSGVFTGTIVSGGRSAPARAALE